MIKIKNKKNGIISKIKPVKKRSFSVRKFIFWLLFLCFAEVVFWILFLSDFTQIKSIEIQTDNFDQEIISRIVKEESSGKYFNIFSKENIFIFPKSRIIKRAQAENALLESLEIKRNFPGGLAIFAKGREGVFVWSSQGRYFLVDKTGTAFLELASDKIGEFKEKFITVNDESTRPANVGEKIISDDLAAFFSNAVKVIEEGTGVSFKNELYTPSLMSNEVRLDSENGWILFLSTEESLEKQLAALNAFFEKQLKSGDAEKLEYIDLRLKGRILYKIKIEEEKEQPEDEELVN